MPDTTPPTIRLGLTEAIMVAGWITSLVALYFGLASKIDLQAAAIEALVKSQAAVLVSIDEMDDRERAHERALTELTVTLRTKDIIK